MYCKSIFDITDDDLNINIWEWVIRKFLNDEYKYRWKPNVLKAFEFKFHFPDILKNDMVVYHKEHFEYPIIEFYFIKPTPNNHYGELINDQWVYPLNYNLYYNNSSDYKTNLVTVEYIVNNLIPQYYVNT